MALKPPVMPLCQMIVRSSRRAWCQARPIWPPGTGRPSRWPRAARRGPGTAKLVSGRPSGTQIRVVTRVS